MNDQIRPDSSGCNGERPVSNREAAGSTPARGSTFEQRLGITYHYVIVRKEMTGGALLAQAVHAAGDSVRAPLPPDTRAVILGATKEQLATLRSSLVAAGVDHAAVLETDGPLEGVVTAIGLVTQARDALLPYLGGLKVYR